MMFYLVKIGYYGGELELLDARISESRSKKVGVLRRKAAGNVYESPKIVLPSQYQGFIDKRFSVYYGRAKYTAKGVRSSSGWSQEGFYLLLFFPDSWNPDDRE